ncbi:MAG TPA: ATP-grasp domain-containing protein, partial [Candidatus Paceibacterota bacterium]
MASIVYVTKDRERAEGMSENDEYFILSDNGFRDTYDLLSDEKNIDFIRRKGSSVLVFKNNIHIEKLCKDKGLQLLNPSAELSEKVENKISQIKWLGELEYMLPKHSVSIVKNIEWNKKFFILQWSHGHTGDGTILIKNENNLQALKDKFPHREARVTDFIKGPMFTLNIVVTAQEILLGNISYQITGMLPFTENPWSTIGNDWSLPHTILTENHIKDIEDMARKIAEKMRRDGWKGLFGIDVIYNEERDCINLIEINARQSASATYESQLQKKNADHTTIFEAHIKALLHEPITKPTIQINDGAQI